MSQNFLHPSPPPTRRIKILWLPPAMLLAILRPNGRYIQMLGIEEMPPDAIVHQIFLSLERTCFGIICSHESFDEVPAHIVPPDFPVTPTVWQAVDVTSIRKAIEPFHRMLFPDGGPRQFAPESYELGVFDACKAVWDLLPEGTPTTLAPPNLPLS